MKSYFAILLILVIGILFLFPRAITREPYDVDIPIRLKLISVVSKYLLSGLVPPKFIRWMQSRKIPQSSDKYDFSFENVTYTHNDETISVTTNVYTPKDLSLEELEEIPILLFFHGGGFVIGHPNTLDPFFQHVMDANEFSTIIVSPNYRKLPEFTYDDAIRDGLETLRWIKKKYGGNHPIIISGESAGGKLTLALVYYLKNSNYEDYDKDKIASVPIYSAFCRTMECRKNSANSKGYIVNEKMVRKMHSEVIKAKKTVEVEFWFDFEDRENLPRTIVVAAEYDYLRDEALEWVKKFDEEEKPEYVMVKGEIHGFIDPMIAVNPSSIRTLAEIVIVKGMNLF